MDSVSSLSELISDQKAPSFFEIRGSTSRAFGQTTLTTTLSVSKLFSIYEVDLEVQRSIVPQNLSKLMDYILLYLEQNQTIYFPGIILSARGAGNYDEEEKIFRLNAIEKLYVIDGQHRLAAFKRLVELFQSAIARAKDRREYDQINEITEKLNKIYQFPLSVMIYLDIDSKQERQLFSDINKLPRKIGGNLAVLREKRKFYHVLASQLVKSAKAMERITVDMFSERGKTPEYVFSYSLLIEVLAGFLEGRLKSVARNNRYQFDLKDVSEQFEICSLYFDRLLTYLPAPEERGLCWSENVQIALALFFHGESTKSTAFNRYELEYAMKILPHLNWDSIYSGDEKNRLPRKTRIMKALQFVKDFYSENHLFVIRDREA